jgi:ribonucleases P/MRP protein subunit RPP40
MLVRVQSTFSGEREVTSGVPQGSILGPLLFNLYTDDIDTIHSKDLSLYKFADDMKLYNIYDPTMTSSTQTPLQSGLNNVHTWCVENELPLNLNKCSVVYFGVNNPRVFYNIAGHRLVSKSCERDLGVLFDEHLNFSPHIDQVVRRARRMVGLLLHTFQSRSSAVILSVYKSMIRPLLEYGSVAWNPYLIKHINQLESVQRMVTKRIAGYSSLRYEDRLTSLHLSTLSCRRQYLDLVEIYKVIHGYSFSTIQYLFLNSNTRGHSFRLREDMFRLNMRKFALFTRAVRLWNSLPSNIVAAKSFGSFKYKLRVHLHV